MFQSITMTCLGFVVVVVVVVFWVESLNFIFVLFSFSIWAASVWLANLLIITINKALLAFMMVLWLSSSCLLWGGWSSFLQWSRLLWHGSICTWACCCNMHLLHSADCSLFLISLINAQQLYKPSIVLRTFLLILLMLCNILWALLSGIFLQILQDLVMLLKGHSLSPHTCPPTQSVPSKRFGY